MLGAEVGWRVEVAVVDTDEVSEEVTDVDNVDTKDVVAEDEIVLDMVVEREVDTVVEPVELIEDLPHPCKRPAAKSARARFR